MNKELLDLAIDNLFINDIYLSSSSIDVNKSFIPEFQKDPLLIQFRNSIQGTSLANISDNKDFKALLIYHYEVAFRAIPQKLSDKVMSDEEQLLKEVKAEVIATFNASYYLKEMISDEAIKEFGFSNVGFNVWPYWREYASSVAVRLRLPHFIVPLKRVKNTQEPES